MIGVHDVKSQIISKEFCYKKCGSSVLEYTINVLYTLSFKDSVYKTFIVYYNVQNIIV